MRTRKQGEETKAKISLSTGIPIQIIDVKTEEIAVYNFKSSAAKLIGTSYYTIGRYIKSKKLLFYKDLITELDGI